MEWANLSSKPKQQMHTETMKAAFRQSKRSGDLMLISRRAATLGGLGLLTGAAMPGALWAQTDAGFATAVDAYVYGYPLITMEITRRVLTNVAQQVGTRGPMGSIIKLRHYPDSSFRDVTAPNADTLYTTSFFDVGDEPWVLTQPDMKDRYFLLPLLSGWTDVFEVPGARTSGGGAKRFLISGPGWKGHVPTGMVHLKSPTAMVWLLGRIYCTGTPEDYAAVHALQDQFGLQPLSSWGKSWSASPKVDPAIDMVTAVREQVNAMSATQYFTLLAELMKTNPPAAADAPALARFANIGLVSGKPFDARKLQADWDRSVPAAGFKAIMGHFTSDDLTVKNGWSFTTKTGLYGTNYLQRSLITAIGLGANRPQDAVYPTSVGPSAGVGYDGSNKYVMHFPAGHLPPVSGFWSLTMYDEGMFFVPNPIDRYSMSMRTNPKLEADGSLKIYVQNTSPGADREANWLPAPPGKFNLMMRLYWPKEAPPSIIDGSWTIPPVIRAG